MCGIAGLVSSRSSSLRQPRVDPALVAELSRRLEHRGPDDQGYLSFGPQGVERAVLQPGSGALRRPLPGDLFSRWLNASWLRDRGVLGDGSAAPRLAGYRERMGLRS